LQENVTVFVTAIGREELRFGGEIAAYRVDRNCQRIRALAPVTLVPVRGRWHS